MLDDFASAVRPYLMQRVYQPDADLGTGGKDIRSMMCSLGLAVKHREWRGSDSGYYTAVSCVAAAEAAVDWRQGEIEGSKVAIEGIAVVGFVANHSLWSFFDKATFDGGFNQLYFVG